MCHVKSNVVRNVETRRGCFNDLIKILCLVVQENTSRVIIQVQLV